jgi:hypothetical protein
LAASDSVPAAHALRGGLRIIGSKDRIELARSDRALGQAHAIRISMSDLQRWCAPQRESANV